MPSKPCPDSLPETEMEDTDEEPTGGILKPLDNLDIFTKTPVKGKNLFVIECLGVCLCLFNFY